MKFKITATVPTGQYANIMPEIEVEAGTYEEAKKEAMQRLEDIWKEYSVVPLKTNSSNRGKRVECFIGGYVNYDDLTHTYTNDKGEVYMSGSQYAKSLEKPFDMEKISQAMADKFGVDAKDLRAMWKLKGEISTGFGTAIHKALELYGRFNGLAETIEKTTNLHDHPVIKKAVESFYVSHKGEEARHEVFIVDHEAKRAGQIDRLLITGDKKCRVQDFKTNADITKSLPSYWVQLQFYADIMTANGWTVEGLDIFHWNGEWKEYTK